MKYGNWTMGQTEALLNKIGLDNAMGLLRGELMFSVVALRKTAEIFTAFVKFLQPSLEKLQREFGCVDDGYGEVKFEPIEACRGIDLTDRDVKFRYFKIRGRMTARKILEAMNAVGIRPATYEELLAFASKYPDEQRKFPIIAFGSVALVEGSKHVACLDEDQGIRKLSFGLGDSEVIWFDDFVFLTVITVIE